MTLLQWRNSQPALVSLPQSELQVRSHLQRGRLAQWPESFGVRLQAAEVEEITISAVVNFDSCLGLGQSCREHPSEEETEQRWRKHTTLLHSIRHWKRAGGNNVLNTSYH